MSLISIIIPCFNYGKYLPNTLNSLIHQTYKNWECIIVNDGSTDNTHEVASVFLDLDKRFKYIYQVNKGISAARNNGIKAATGDFIQLIDADDLIEFKKLEEQILVFKNNPSYDIVYSSVRFFRNHLPNERLFSLGRGNKSWMPNISGRGDIITEYLIQSNIMATNCPLFRKKVFDQAGLFDEKLRVLEDWDFWIRCALSNLYFYYLDKPDTLALVRVHSKSISNNTWDMRYMELLMKKDLSNKINSQALNKIIDEQIFKIKKTLVAIAVYDLLKGNVHAFINKIKIISEKDTFSAATWQIVKKKYFPEVSLSKIYFYGKKLITTSK